MVNAVIVTNVTALGEDSVEACWRLLGGNQPVGTVVNADLCYCAIVEGLYALTWFESGVGFYLF